jgi:hypothetical protein
MCCRFNGGKGNCIRCKDARDVLKGHKKKSRYDPPEAPRPPSPTTRQKKYREWATHEWNRILRWLDRWHEVHPEYRRERWYPRSAPVLVNYGAGQFKWTSDEDFNRHMTECATAFVEASKLVVGAPPPGVRALEKRRRRS